MALVQICVTGGRASGARLLFYALKAGKRADTAAMIDVLVKSGADIGQSNRRGATPREIMLRTRRPDKEAIAFLLEATN